MKRVFIDINHDLIKECRKGSRVAQYKIYKLYYKAMYNTAFRIVNDTMEAEDIMQESFITAFRSLSAFNETASFGSWLKRIVINNALDALRKSKELFSIEEEHLEIPATEDQIAEEEIQFQVHEIKAAIEKLPDNYRIVLSLYLLEGYDHEEISDILKISYQLSRTRYSRARQKLLGMLKENKTKNVYQYN